MTDDFLNITGVGTTQKAGNFVFLHSSRYSFLIIFPYLSLLSSYFHVHSHPFAFYPSSYFCFPHIISLLILLFIFLPSFCCFSLFLCFFLFFDVLDILTGPVVMHGASEQCLVSFSALGPFSCIIKMNFRRDISDYLRMFLCLLRSEVGLLPAQ